MASPLRRPRWLLLAACCQAALCLRAFPPLRRTQPPLMTLLTPEGRARAALARPSGVGLESGLLRSQQSKSLPKRLKDAAIVSVVKASERLWQDVFQECDVDNDDSITRRELLVLMKRLDLEIPNEEELSRLISESDIDEVHLHPPTELTLPCLPTLPSSSGACPTCLLLLPAYPHPLPAPQDGNLSFNEFTTLIRKLGVSRTVDVVGTLEGGLRSAVRSYVKEKRGVVLWRDVFDRLDRFPRDGMIDAFELQQAFEQPEGLTNPNPNPNPTPTPTPNPNPNPNPS